jgi:predicted transcriptional regulator of viral defense system
MPPPPRKQPADGPQTSKSRTFEARRRLGVRLAGLAQMQHGVVTLDQLRGIGISASAVRSRVEEGSLLRLYDGVYAVGHLPRTKEVRFISAVLACGRDAVLSHRSAAHLLGLREDKRIQIDVTAPGRRGRAPRGIDAHRDGSLVPLDRGTENGIPCTNVARTLLDLAAVIPLWELRRAVGKAEVLRVLDKGAVRTLIKRNRGRRGVARLRMLLDELDPQTKRTRSEMERLLLRLCTRAGLPRPEVNIWLNVDGRQLQPDFLWRDVGLILEADSRKFHDTDSAFLSDRRREQRLQLAGWRVSHCTWWEIEHEPSRLANTIRGLLALPTPSRRASYVHDLDV